MEYPTLDTFFGKLTQSPVTNGLHHNDNNDPSISSYYYIQYLERKVTILEDIVNTSSQIAELNQTLMSNHDQTVQEQVLVSDVSVQTDLESLHHSVVESVSLQTDIQISPRLYYEPASPQTHVEYDGIWDVPQSFMLIDEQGNIEASDSILGVAENQTDCSGNPWIENYFQTLAVSSISNESLSSGNDILDDTVIDFIEPLPVELVDDKPFSKFCLDTLLRELNFTHCFQNRKAIYYGQFPYHYNGGKHEARDIPLGSYLESICSYLDVLFPDYEYNSVLINFYANGQDYIPLHSDTEDCIEDDSYIVTVSLGATRTLMFQEVSTGHDIVSTDLQHGDVSIMSRRSQDYFKHEIVPDSLCSYSRISLTFRLIKPQVPQRHDSTSQRMDDITDDGMFDNSSSDCGYVPYREHTYLSASLNPHHTAGKPNKQNYHASQAFATIPPGQSHQDIETIYISSSLFRELDASKLSSSDQRAKVFFYPGANSHQMANRLLQDSEFQSINKKSVKQVFLLTGTNYVDSVSSGSLPLSTAIDGIDEICSKLWTLCVNAQLNVINILPRADNRKNNIVNKLNDAIIEICKTQGLNFIDTEYNVRLFSNNYGARRSFYFKRGFDNVHLNRAGITRLGKHLKYLAHHM